MLENNKFVCTLIQMVKENVIKNKEPIHNPITLIGLNKEKRYRFFWCFFDKDFNSQYKSFISYGTIDKMDLESVYKKKIIIIENVHSIVGNKEQQNKLQELLDRCFKLKIQVILCSDESVDELEIDEVVKSKMLYGGSMSSF